MNIAKLATLLTTSDSQIIKASAVKMAVAVLDVANNIEQDASIKRACALYGIEYNKDNAHYEKAKGFYKDYLKVVSEMRQHLAPVFEAIKGIDFEQAHSKVAAQVLDLDLFKTVGQPRNKTQWIEFLKGYLPASEKPAKDPKANTVTTKGEKGDGGKAATEATANINTEIERLFDKLEAKHAQFVNGYMETLRDQNLPKVHQAKVSKAMLKMLVDYDATIKAEMQK